MITGVSGGADAVSRAVEVAGERMGGVRIGKAEAPVVVVVFTDYTCPHCVTLHGETLEGLRKTYVESGKALLEIRHLPRLDDTSLGLVRAALAAERVVRAKPVKDGVDWRVWEFQKSLFEFAGVLPEKGYAALAGEKGVDEAAFRQAWEAIDVRAELLVDADLADSVGLKSLPEIVVFPNTKRDAVKGTKLDGEVTAAALAAEIERVAKAAGKP